MNPNDTPSRLFFLAEKGIDLIQNFRSLTKNGKFEVLLFNTEIVLDTYRSNKPNNFGKVQEEYFRYFEDYISQNRISSEIEDLSGFINDRFVFYADELNKIFSPTYIPGKLYNAFYNSALSLKLEINFDLPNVMMFSIALKEMAKYVNNEVNLISKNENV